MMYRAEFKSTKEVIYMDDLRGMIKYISGILRFHKSHLRGNRPMTEVVRIKVWDKKHARWDHYGSMYLYYDPRFTCINRVSMVSAGRHPDAMCEWADEREVYA